MVRNSKVTHAVIAAAGMGTRLGHGLPKCLVSVNGSTLIESQLRLLREVPTVRVVAGYRKDEVMDAARKVRSDVEFACNSRYEHTSTQDSYVLGALGLAGHCLFLDADIWFDPSSFSSFLDRVVRYDVAIGVTKTKTDDAVYAHLQEVSNRQCVTAFSRTERSEYEWANILWAHTEILRENSGAVFETVSEHLPATAIEIDSFEVDTEADLARARAAASTWMGEHIAF
jgi:choline kinase